MFFSESSDVPRGTNQFMKLFSILCLCLMIAACNKPDPNPELMDPIYKDLSSSITSLNQQLEAEQKALEENETNLKQVIPQTGQNKYAEKRIRESKERIIKLNQEKAYIELKLEAQKRKAKKSYLLAYNKGEIWPNSKDWDEYQIQKKFRTASPIWDVKKRISDLGGPEKEKAPGSAPKSSH